MSASGRVRVYSKLTFAGQAAISAVRFLARSRIRAIGQELTFTLTTAMGALGCKADVLAYLVEYLPA